VNDTIQRADVGRADVSLVHLDVGVPVDRQFDAIALLGFFWNCPTQNDMKRG
jgi:hypothetical protein